MDSIEKLKSIVEFKNQYLKDFGKKIVINNNKKYFFYFQQCGDKKIVSKSSLQNIYMNDCAGLFNFFRQKNSFLPKLCAETKHFFIFEWVGGETLHRISKEDFDILSEITLPDKFWPFCNSLYTNIVKTPEGIINIVDLKHFDFGNCDVHDNVIQHFWVFMHNEKAGVNTLYIKNVEHLPDIQMMLQVDYDISNMEIEDFGC